MLKLNKVIQRWIYVDSRTLALFRIFFGLMGLIDVLRRYSVIDVFYSDLGMNFRRQVSSKYSIKYFTLLDQLHSAVEVRIFFIATIICFILLIIGYRTRLFQILSAIGLISIHNAAVILENGADMVFNSYLVWMLFLPLGTSLSVDSLRRSFNREPDNDISTKIENRPQRIFHIAYLACLIQLSMIYFYNHINKTGDMWIEDFSAVYYMYQLDTFLTPLGAWIASLLNTSIIKLLTFSTIYMEMLAPIAILSPFFQPWLRRIAFIIFMIFHLIIGLSVNIGMFSWVMMSVLILLLGVKEIEYLKYLLSKLFNRNYIVFYDRDCGICHFLARLFKRIDIFSRLVWSDRLTKGDRPKNLDTLLETTIVVWNKEDDIVWTRHQAFSKILLAIPFGFLISWILLIPGLEKIFGYIYDFISRNRARFSNLAGLPACGIERKVVHGSDSVQKPIIRKIRKGLLISSNVIVLLLLIAVIDYSLQINDGVKNSITTKNKKVMSASSKTKLQNYRRTIKRILLYPRMYQEWNMFSPRVLTHEKWALADITFKNGEKLTLFKNDDKIEEKFNYKYFSPYNNQFWRKLFGRLGKSNYSKYIPKFKKWLAGTDYFSEYEGRAVKDVKLWKLSERSLDFGRPASEQKKVRKSVLKKTSKRSKGSKNKNSKRNKVKVQNKRPKVKSK